VVASILGSAATAQADESVVVLGLTSIDGDDQYAQALTGALRHAATAVRGWQVSERDVSLANLELVAGCEAAEAGCLTQIATTLTAQRLIYGTITRTGGDHYEFAVSIFSYNATSNEVEEHVDRTLSSARTDIDDLRDPARAMIEQLAHVQHVGSIRVTASSGQTVSVDGTQVGTTDSNGVYVASAVASGSHQVVVGGGEARTVMVSDGAEAALAISGASSSGGGGGGGGPSLDWLAISLLGLAGVGIIGTIVSWAELASLSNDAAYNQYRMNLGSAGLMGDIACQPSSIGTLGTGPAAAHVQDVCNQGSTFEILQYVFLGVTVAAGAAGVVLLVMDSSNSHSEPATATTVSLVPSFGPNSGSMTLRMRF
jgi:hypothetical protein